MKKHLLISGVLSAVFLALPLAALADTVGPINFESYVPGNINSQDGWTKTGTYDVAVDGSFSVTGFGTQSLRLSNAVTSGSFGDQTFAKPLTDSVGETSSTAGSFSVGTKQTHFEMQFDIASTMPTEQSGMFMSVSPDRGDGSRMSYLSFADAPTGIDVTFYDVQGTSNLANFVSTDLGLLDRSTKHTIKLTMDTIDGPSNDVVKVWIDGVLVHTGTSWENYYRYDSEAAAEQTPRIVKTVLFRESGAAVPGNVGKGFLIDNLSLQSGPTTPSTIKVTIDKFIDGSMATAATANNSAFPMASSWNATNIGAGSGTYSLSTTGFNSPTAYEAVTADMTSGADYSTNEVTGGTVVGATCADGKPFALVGYTTGDTLQIAQTAPKSTTAPSFTGLASDKYVIVWNQTCPPPPQPLSCPVGTSKSASPMETVTVPANASTDTLSANSLVNGTSYILKAYGTADAGDGITFDARYSFRTPTSAMWTDAVSTYEGYGPTLLDLFYNSTTPWGSYNSSHDYEYLAAGNGVQAHFLINDVYYPNNTGNLSVDISPCMPNIKYVTGGGDYKNGTGKSSIFWTFGGNVWMNNGSPVGQFELVNHNGDSYHFNTITSMTGTGNTISFDATGTTQGKTKTSVTAHFTIVDNGQGGGKSKTPDTISFSISDEQVLTSVPLTGGNFQVYVQ